MVSGVRVRFFLREWASCEWVLRDIWKCVLEQRGENRGAEKPVGEGSEKGNEGGRKPTDLGRTRGALSGMVCLQISYWFFLIITTLPLLFLLLGHYLFVWFGITENSCWSLLASFFFAWLLLLVYSLLYMVLFGLGLTLFYFHSVTELISIFESTSKLSSIVEAHGLVFVGSFNFLLPYLFLVVFLYFWFTSRLAPFPAFTFRPLFWNWKLGGALQEAIHFPYMKNIFGAPIAIVLESSGDITRRLFDQ